ncbi:MAG TPA: CRISPR-associated protein Cas4 [Fibrobacteria bacterium]|nr:CRISPR-associated protein Cas4 [Fibrobacteria bacterium]HOX50314.1 CRISPR-associated protein Cas4 [Fibrobacteria bacterium]
MTPREEDLHPISALQHMAFCPRQAGLIHLEQVWAENKRTAEGRTLHERVDEGYREFRKGLRQFSGLRVQSLRLGIAGRLDVLELEKSDAPGDNAAFLGLEGHWSFHPVEFKRGEPKDDDWDAVQLCAQALCIEEMTGAVVDGGAIFYGEIRRREEVALTTGLRVRTEEVAQAFGEMMTSRILPPPLWKKGCCACSLIDLCQPKAGAKGKAGEYLKELLG